MIEIAFITDENYVLPTLTAIISIKENIKEAVNINVIYSSKNEYDVKNFKNLSDEKVNVNVIQIENPYKNIGVEHQHVSKAAMIKFMLPNIFSDKDKILYLDSDMLVLDDITELYNIDLGNNYAAVVEDYEAKLQDCHNIINVPKFFNSGMMLLNLDLLRKENVIEKLLEAKKNEISHQFMDQNAFNIVFNKRFISISPKYNLMRANLEHPIEDISEFYEIPVDEMQNIIDNPKILHLTNIKKPWSDFYAPIYIQWIEYCKKLPLDIQLYYLLKNRDLYNKKSLQRLRDEIIQGIENNNNTLKNDFSIQMENTTSQLNELTTRLNDLEAKYNELTEYTFLEKIFSIKNRIRNNIKHKVITILGIKFKFRAKEK